MIYIASTSRLLAHINTLAAQGWLLFLICITGGDLFTEGIPKLWSLLFIIFETLVIKSFVIPIFLRKIVRGSTDDSYGIEVAKLAGLPNEVIKRAREVLAVVERSSKSLTTSEQDGPAEEKDDSLITMDDYIHEQVIEELRGMDINTLSPYEAMSFLFNLQKRLK